MCVAARGQAGISSSTYSGLLLKRHGSLPERTAQRFLHALSVAWNIMTLVNNTISNYHNSIRPYHRNSYSPNPPGPSFLLYPLAVQTRPTDDSISTCHCFTLVRQIPQPHHTMCLSVYCGELAFYRAFPTYYTRNASDMLWSATWYSPESRWMGWDLMWS